MGKIRLQDLARKMGLPEQDLMFKLRSIGVRVEGEEAAIDSDIIHALLQGKRLPQPREVILRDDATEAPPPPVPQWAGRQPLRRQPAPYRPPRRTIIQRTEKRIQEIPTRERPTPGEAPGAAPPAEARPAVESRPAAAAPPAAPAAEIKPSTPPPAPKAAPPTAAKRAAAKPAAPASRPRTQPAAAKPTSRPAARPPRRTGARLISRPTGPLPPKSIRGRGRPGRLPSRPSEPVAPLKPASARGQRRAQRRQDSQEQPSTLLFRDERPEGPVTVTEHMTVREFAEKLGVKAKDLIRILISQGMMVTINHVLDTETAQRVAEELGVEVMEVTVEEEAQLQHELEKVEGDVEKQQRSPVVTVMGHVDHGKTTLLDAIRSTNVVSGEAGGITQHIGAYLVELDERRIVFLDTPGHEAFTMMRARGASVTDLVILVVAADDSVMPQTIEAINHARAAEVPIIVAINKIDKPNANLDRVKKELADHNLMVEDWGGDTVAVEISALRREGVSELLEMVAITADLLELKAAPEIPASGVVLEARKEVGRGIIGTLLVQDGTLSVGDVFVAGSTWGRVRSMMSDRGERLKTAGPATPVEITGFNDVPSAGDVFQVFADESKARDIAGFRSQEERKRDLAPRPGKMSLEQLFSKIEGDEVRELPVVIKGDVHGSIEVLRDTLEKLSTDKVTVKVIHSGVGAISTNDVILASASGAIVVGFNVRPERNAASMADKEGVDLRLHTVIYELVDELKKAMAGLLEPTFQEVQTGTAEVRDTFRVPRVGVVAGCYIRDGVIPRNAEVRLLRDNVVIYEGKIASLRRFKDDVSEVRSGFECGIGLEGFQDIKPGDLIEAFTREEVAATL